MRREALWITLFALASCSSSTGARRDATPDDAAIDAPVGDARATDAVTGGETDATLGDVLDAGVSAAVDAPRDAAGDVSSDLARDVGGEQTLDGDIGPSRDAALDAAPRDARPRDCDFSTTYRFGFHGGLSRYEFDGIFAPGRSFTIRRTESWATFLDAAAPTCTTTIAGCMGPDAGFDLLSDVLDALDAPDVVAAFAQPPGLHYGDDPTAYDVHDFVIERADGRGFSVGTECGGEPSCRALTPGLARLRAVCSGALSISVRLPECSVVVP